MTKELNHSLAVSDKKVHKALQKAMPKKRPHVHKKQKGMPW